MVRVTHSGALFSHSRLSNVKLLSFALCSLPRRHLSPGAAGRAIHTHRCSLETSSAFILELNEPPRQQLILSSSCLRRGLVLRSAAPLRFLRGEPSVLVTSAAFVASSAVPLSYVPVDQTLASSSSGGDNIHQETDPGINNNDTTPDHVTATERKEWEAGLDHASPSSSSDGFFSPTAAQQFVRHQSKLLRSIVGSSANGFLKKKRRIAGVFQKLERDAPQWLMVVPGDMTSTGTAYRNSSPQRSALLLLSRGYVDLLAAFAAARVFICSPGPYPPDRDRRPHHGAHGSTVGRGDHALSGSGSSGVVQMEGGLLAEDSASAQMASGPSGLSPALHDLLSLCLQTAVSIGVVGVVSSSSGGGAGSSVSALAHPDMLSLLASAVDLALNSEAVEQLCRKVTTTELLRDAPPADLAETLRLVSLAVKRCHVVPPSLFALFSHITAVSRLEHRQVLLILSSLVRLQSAFDTDITRSVSRRGVDHVAHYTVRDVVFALTAIAYLPHVDERYTAEVLGRCSQLCPQFSATNLGDVSKYVALLHPGRKRNTVAHFCEPEIRRLVYAIADRSQQLLYQFRLRDARYVLRCLKQHNVKHSLVFASLVPSTLCA